MEDNCINPKSVIRPQIVHSYDSMVLFPNIFYFLIDTLCVFVTWRSPLRLRSKAKQSLDNKTKYVEALMTELGLKIRELILYYAANQLPLQCFNSD